MPSGVRSGVAPNRPSGETKRGLDPEVRRHPRPPPPPPDADLAERKRHAAGDLPLSAARLLAGDGKIGMRREGLLRQDRRAKGAWRDTYLYAILATDWSAARL